MAAKPIIIAAASQAGPVTVLAAPDLLGLPWASIGIGLIIAGVGGLVGTLRRAQGGDITRRVLVADQVFALAAGFIAFGWATDQQWSSIGTGVLCLIAGFGGQTILDVALSVITKRGGQMGSDDAAK